MNPHNLFSLLTERLMLNSPQLTMKTYNALFEVGIILNPNGSNSSIIWIFFICLRFQILTERMTHTIETKKHTEPDSSYRLENPRESQKLNHGMPCKEISDMSFWGHLGSVLSCSCSESGCQSD